MVVLKLHLEGIAPVQMLTEAGEERGVQCEDVEIYHEPGDVPVMTEAGRRVTATFLVTCPGDSKHHNASRTHRDW